ncbi:PREDICTED: uncharacterized protein LOC109216102 isoform X2 [Nicotiana attenuata]|uniref:AT3G52170-like helix-turn-helix domain-containing protein n=2 Tax=Nicotiana attenuata TaxID=49451 RepID=A0A1J6K4D3_NICAT|nr:PREDICTED: uncharacterized protein LOC109216102 isoform X2 [Nicotiana attenuata]OIT24922.1 hypothetical protein A4A49_27740 [Nicotiana attenuata]
MQIVRRLSVNLSKRVVDGASNSVRGKSFAASAVPSDSAAVKRQRKRVSKDERKAMVEAFVNKYRAMNGGKFPPTKGAMKEVGGSYYTIKKLVQELQYNSRMAVEHKVTVVKEASTGEAATRKDKLLTKVEETLSSATAFKHGECEDGQLTNGILLEKEFTQNRKPSPELKEILSDRQAVDVGISQEAQPLTIRGDTNSNHEAGAKPQTPIAAEKSFGQEMSRISGSDNKDAATQVLEPELETFSHFEEPETSIKQKVSTMETFKFDGLKLTDEQKHSPELEKPTRELSNEHKADTQAESNSSMWRNLKSLAAGILNMWRKR